MDIGVSVTLAEWLDTGIFERIPWGFMQAGYSWLVHLAFSTMQTSMALARRRLENA